VCLKLGVSAAQGAALAALQAAFAQACRHVSALAATHQCRNRVQLHHLGYYALRGRFPQLGAQMACNAVAAVSAAYTAYFANHPAAKATAWPLRQFRENGAVPFDKRTSTLKGQAVSLFPLNGRTVVPMVLGARQQALLAAGAAKEAELVRRGGRFSLHLARDLADRPPLTSDVVLGVDVGENVIAATSSGKVIDGGKLRHDRDRFLALRARLQGNGSPSAKQLLENVSGRERRHVTHVNHVVSKQIVAEAVAAGAGVVALEDLTPIRKRLKAGWARAGAPAPLGVATAPGVCRLQGQGRRSAGRLRRPGLHQPDLFGVPATRNPPEASLLLCLWSPRAQRLELKSEPCEAWRDRRRAKGCCKPPSCGGLVAYHKASYFSRELVYLTIAGAASVSKNSHRKSAADESPDPLFLGRIDFEQRLGQMSGVTARAARRAGQADAVAEGVAAGEARGRGDGQPFAAGREALGEVGEVSGHRLFRDPHQPGEVARRQLLAAQGRCEGLAQGGVAGGGGTRLGHRSSR